VLAKLAKDVAAGAVLISAINAICVAYLMFYDKALILFNKNIQVTRIAGRTGNIVVLILALTALIVITIKAFYKKGTPLEGGMPSGHSAIAFSVFAMILFMTPDIKIISLALIMALLVAQSRVKAGIHSIREVLIGGLIGFLIAFIIMGIVIRFGILYN
jgi:diacylglycerol kinase (ATP)